MSTATSEKLLARYVRDGSEQAFEQIVSRHINLVYSTALRRTGGKLSLAEDIAQIVFSEFARKARSIPTRTPVAGWLHQHSCFTAAKVLRREVRRQVRERVAVEVNTSLREHTTPSPSNAFSRRPANTRTISRRWFPRIFPPCQESAWTEILYASG
ncbi:MAG: hypothetical protein L0Z50_33570 [Verrucomicrobiales bacterium]|nr:hypothetical protein [Verrucomicrobiales bacterium]